MLSDCWWVLAYRFTGRCSGKVKSAFGPRGPIRPALNSGFRGMKRLGVFLLPPGWDASPSQGYPTALNSPVPICTPGWREALWELSVLPKNTTQCPRPGLEPGRLAPETSALTMRPLCLPVDVQLLVNLLFYDLCVSFLGCYALHTDPIVCNRT